MTAMSEILPEAVPKSEMSQDMDRGGSSVSRHKNGGAIACRVTDGAFREMLAEVVKLVIVVLQWTYCAATF